MLYQALLKKGTNKYNTGFRFSNCHVFLAIFNAARVHHICSTVLKAVHECSYNQISIWCFYNRIGNLLSIGKKIAFIILNGLVNYRHILLEFGLLKIAKLKV